ncbi:thiol reductant ABC exporter subunit CydC [Kushneria phosphatilytica]|uniref:Thiol reductant ABC exporter subunit CydC n=1 Tax=Kushneria phosphatilytica TaxID=657387 RepID=A0A1S1NYU4_9GAMM|nr:thiol reductant ABC exporter subunit CydC [Kushneria phosphatilytica]OHV12851.1 thiol reductant ABC exporter subunit CydC [Kushneria phosphatilytica]QEL10705.1 thiol reductant ABC exporter subunit CydC [Kushneria phosphatilytica]
MSAPSADPARVDLRPWLGQMRPFAWLMALGILLNLIALASSVGLIALSGWFLSAAAVAGTSAATAATFNFLLPSAGVRGFAITRTAGRYGERVASHEGTLKLLSRLRWHLYRAIEPLSPTALQHYGSSDLMARLTADVDALDNLYLRVVTPSIVALGIIVLCGVIIGVFAPPIGLFAAVALAISGTLGPWLAWRRGHHLSHRWQVLNTHLRARLLERLPALSELLLYERWQPETESLLKDQQERDAHELALAGVWGRSQLLSQILLGITITVVLAMAAWWSLHRNLSPTLIALMGLSIMGAFEAVAMLPQAWQNLGRIQRAAGRLEELTTRVPSICFPAESLDKPNDNGLDIRELEVRFDDGTTALSNFSLTLAPGEHFALLGPSGGGKTTLLNTLVRFLSPTHGRILLGGVSIDALDEPTLRASMGIAPQDTHLFVASYRDNLKLGNPEAGDDELHQLLQALDLSDWLSDQPEGLDSYPDEGGSSLSGGQLKRFGIARALLTHAPILLLDEPTEGLDEQTARRVLSTIRTHAKGRTLLMITHHVSGLDQLDRIGIMDEGHLLEIGPPQQLLEDIDSRFSALQQQIVL